MTKPLTYRIGADLSDLARGMDEGIRKTAGFKRELAELERQQRQHRAAMTDLGQGALAFGTALAVGLGLATKAAIQWESAFAGVRKTVDGSDAEIAALEGELRKLTHTLPATHEEIAGVAEAAGQLGIKRADIASFTKTMIDLGESTNLTADEAATSLAKFSNIMGTSAKDADRLGSALVALGNDGASTEADILAMALGIAGAGRVVGMTEAQVLSFASAISSVGIEAEAGGSSFSTVMIKMAVAAREGGDAIEGFAKVAGMSGKAFAELFQRDAAMAIQAFLAGLKRMQSAGEDVFGVLDQLGLSEIRVRRMLLSASGAAEMLAHSLEVGNQAWIENTALAEEAGKRYATTEARIKIAGNQIKDAMIDVGAAIGPAFAAGTQAVADVARAFSELPDPVKNVVAVVGLAAAGIALVGGAALVAAPKVLAFRESMRTLEATGGAMGGAMGKFGLFMSGPWGLAITAGVTLLGMFAAGSGAASRQQQELAEAGKSVADAIREQNGQLNESVRQTAAKAASEKGLLQLAKDLKIDLPRVTDAVLQQGSAYGDLIGQLQKTIDAGTIVSITGQGAVVTMSAEAQAATDLKDGLIALVGGKNAQLEATKNTVEATEESSDAARANAAALEEEANQAKEAAAAFEALLENLNKLNGITLSARDAQRGYLEQLQETAETFKANGAGLDNNTEKGRENAAALDAQAKAAGELAEALAREAEKQGGATAGAAAFKASLDASRPALIANARAFGMSEQEAQRYADSVLAAADITVGFSRTTQAELQRVSDAVRNVPANKSINVGALTEAAKEKLRDIGYKVETLPDGTVTITGNTAPAFQSLNNFLNTRAVKVVTVMTAYGPGITTGGRVAVAQGGVVSFAGGGMWEDHAPQIVKAQPGTVRIWAEPETDKESYIPWAMDRRARATAVLGQTAEAFGYALVPRSHLAFGHGGITGQPSPGGGVVNLNVGVIGSRQELLNWLTRAFDDLRSKGRA